MSLYTAIRVITQKGQLYPGVGAGPLDDCWVLASLMGVALCAPWKWLVSVADFRKAAGVPDTNTGSEGGSVADASRALRALYADIAVVLINKDQTWAQFLALLQAGHPAYVSVVSSYLPANYGFAGDHAVTVVSRPDGALDIYNPLANAYTSATKITVAQLQAAMLARGGVLAVVFPTPDEQFTKHPLYASSGITQTQLDSAKQASYNAGYLEAKQKAVAATSAI